MKRLRVELIRWQSRSGSRIESATARELLERKHITLHSNAPHALLGISKVDMTESQLFGNDQTALLRG